MKSIYALLVSALLAAPAIAQPVVTAFSYQAYVDAPRADRLDFAAYAVERADGAAHDMDADGIDDIGLWVPDTRSGGDSGLDLWDWRKEIDDLSEFVIVRIAQLAPPEPSERRGVWRSRSGHLILLDEPDAGADMRYVGVRMQQGRVAADGQTQTALYAETYAGLPTQAVCTGASRCGDLEWTCEDDAGCECTILPVDRGSCLLPGRIDAVFSARELAGNER